MWGDGSKSTNNVSLPFKKPAVAVTNELLLASAAANSTVSEKQRDTSSFLHQFHGLCKPEGQGYFDHRYTAAHYSGNQRIENKNTLKFSADSSQVDMQILGRKSLDTQHRWTPCRGANSWCWWCHCHAGGQCHIHPNEFAWSPNAPRHGTSLRRETKNQLGIFRLNE